MGSYVELLKACKEGNQKKVKKLLGECTDVGDVRDLTDKTLLHYCFKYESCADLILEAAPELLDVGEKNGYTVLHLASMIKPPTSLKYLLSKEPDINKRNNDSRSSLLLAVIYNNYEAIELLCQHKAEVNLSDISGVTPLHYAAKIKSDKDQDDESKSNIIDILLNNGANIESFDLYERSPLIWAVCSNNIDKMKYLIDRGANIYTKDSGGLSILHYATSNGNLEIIKILLDIYHFNIDTVDVNNCTALMYACSYNHCDAIEFLLERGSNVNAEDSKRRNAAHFACGKGELKSLKILYNFHIDIWKLNSDSNYPFHESAYKGHKDILQFLIDHLDPNNSPQNFINHKNSNGQTALHLATVKDHKEICEILLQNGADPNISLRVNNGKSMTALDLANTDIVRDLIVKYNGKSADNLLKTSVIKEELSISTTISEESCDSEDSVISTIEKEQSNNENVENIQEHDSETYKNNDSNTNKNEVIKEEIFIQSEININENENPRLNRTNQQEIEVNVENRSEILEITEEYQKALLSLCYNDNTDEINEFIRKGGSLYDISDKTGKSMLHYSLKNYETFELIIKNAPLLINKPDNCNVTVLHMVIMSKKNDRIASLLDNSCDVNYADDYGRTAMHLAVLHNNPEALSIMYDFLQDKNQFIHKADIEGNFPMHYAVQICKLTKIKCYCELFLELLIKMNGDIECRDNVNRTPLLLAVNMKNFEAVSVLLKYDANIMAMDNQNLCSIHYVCSEGSLEIFDKIAALETFQPNIKDPNGLTPIFYAISSCNEKIVKKLIELNARTDVIDQHGRNICHKAAEKGAFKCLELLLKYKIDPWLKSEDGSLPLHDAAYRGYKEIAEILLNTESAADNVNVKNNSGQTALHLAAVRNDCPMCYLLISKGSNVNELLHRGNDDEDFTAYDLATTPDCKETLYSFGGRSAKRIIDCISLDNEFENDEYKKDLECLLNEEDNGFFNHPSIRSTELALSTMPSAINTVRNSECCYDQKMNSKPSSKKSESLYKRNQSIVESDVSETNNNNINENYKEISPEPIDIISFIPIKCDQESNLQIDSETISQKPISNSSKNSVLSESLKSQKSTITINHQSARKCISRSKSTKSNSTINIKDKSMVSKVQNSVLNYEYARLNCRFAIDMARQKIRDENVQKLINPKTPKILKRSKLQKPKVART